MGCLIEDPTLPQSVLTNFSCFKGRSLRCSTAWWSNIVDVAFGTVRWPSFIIVPCLFGDRRGDENGNDAAEKVHHDLDDDSDDRENPNAYTTLNCLSENRATTRKKVWFEHHHPHIKMYIIYIYLAEETHCLICLIDHPFPPWFSCHGSPSDEVMKSLLLGMASTKLNVLHWHLTDAHSLRWCERGGNGLMWRKWPKYWEHMGKSSLLKMWQLKIPWTPL